MINRVVINRACSYEDMHHLTDENGKKKMETQVQFAFPFCVSFFTF